MKKRSLKKKIATRRPKRDCNYRLPDGLTEIIRQEIELLPGINPKERYLKEQCFSKYCSPDPSEAEIRRTRAVEKWLGQESLNGETNLRLRNTDIGYLILPDVAYGKFISKVSEIIATVIGEVVPDDALLGAFSGGSSTSKSRTESHPTSKYLGEAHCTAKARPWFSSALEMMQPWTKVIDDLTIVEMKSNQLFTVPKNSVIDRVAAKEPDLNMFLQKGAGLVIRKALKQVGIDLNDQSRNQRLAREGSVSGHLMTVDLSSASDSVTSELVFQLLPIHWYLYLDDIRCHSTDIDGTCHENEMFSSMGNGFTFELESLLFYAITRAVAYFRGVSGIISVYGDDIIAPSCLYDDLTWVLSYLGFRVNLDKSFADGTFRESCGGHYDNGHDITPFYVRGPVTRLTDLINICNKIRQWSSLNEHTVLDPALEDLWVFLSHYVPQCYWGGTNYGSNTQLVTPHRPLKRLQEITQRPVLTNTGGYLMWLNSCFNREMQFRFENDTWYILPVESVQTSEHRKATMRYRSSTIKFADSLAMTPTRYLSEV